MDQRGRIIIIRLSYVTFDSASLEERSKHLIHQFNKQNKLHQGARNRDAYT